MKLQRLTTLLIIIVIAFGCGFYTAYLSFANTEITPLTSNPPADFEHQRADTTYNNNVKSTNSNPTLSFTSQTHKEVNQQNSFSSQVNQSDNIITMFNEVLSAYEKQNSNNTDANSTITEFKRLLSSSPSAINELLEHMHTLDFESQEFHYLISILHELPEKIGSKALLTSAIQMSQFDDAQSTNQFLLLASNMERTAENPEIHSALVNIAINTAQSARVSLDALNLIKPYVVNDYEKEQILSHLNALLDTNGSLSQDIIVNHWLRFSNSRERESFAYEYINLNQDLETRHTILQGLQSGLIPRTQSLKERLLNAANNHSDPLRNEAIQVLKSVFYISNIEYQQLTN